jgi:hypothetical protein
MKPFTQIFVAVILIAAMILSMVALGNLSVIISKVIF